MPKNHRLKTKKWIRFEKYLPNKYSPLRYATIEMYKNECRSKLKKKWIEEKNSEVCENCAQILKLVGNKTVIDIMKKYKGRYIFDVKIRSVWMLCYSSVSFSLFAFRKIVGFCSNIKFFNKRIYYTFVV